MPKRRADNSTEEEESFEHSTTVPTPIFAPVLPPMLTSIAHDALVQWSKRRREYEAKMRAHCRNSGEDYDSVTQGVKETFDVSLLETFCSLRLRQDVADVTEGMLVAEIKALLGKSRTTTYLTSRSCSHASCGWT